MICPTCGNTFSEGEAFCGQCGTPNPQMSAPIHNRQSNHPYTQKPTSYQKNEPIQQLHQTVRLPPLPSATDLPDFYNTSLPDGPDPLPEARIFQSDLHVQSQKLPRLHSGTMYTNNSEKEKNEQRPMLFQDFSKKTIAEHTPIPQTTGLQHPKKRTNQTIMTVICVLLLLGIIAVINVAVIYHNETTATKQNKQATITTPNDPLSCTQMCQAYHFTFEYPRSWNITALADNTGVYIQNPHDRQQQATFQTLGQTKQTADVILSEEVQKNTGGSTQSQQSIAMQTITVGGVTWRDASINHQGEFITTYTTVYQNKAFAIEMQEPEKTSNQQDMQNEQKIIQTFQFK